MTALINLVATNSVDGDHALLQRWYADHAHLLFRFEGLHEATLLQRTDVAQGLKAVSAAFHYLCFYRFASPEAFADFEVSDVRASAPKLGKPEWMKGGIHIASRQQYHMVTSRTRGDGAQWANAAVHVRSVRLAAPPEPLALERWLQGGIHAALQQSDVAGVQLLRRTTPAEGQAEYVSVVRGSAAGALTDIFAASSTPGLGDAPSSQELLWQASYQPVGHWLR